MILSSGNPLTAANIDRVVNEILVKALADLIREHELGLARSAEEAEFALKQIQTDHDILAEEARRRDFARAKPVSAAMSAELGFEPSPDPEVRQTLYARSFSALRQINDLTLEVEKGRTFDVAIGTAHVPTTALSEARDLVRGARATIQDAFDISIKHQTSNDNRNHSRSAMRVAVEFWGPVPLSTLGPDDVVKLLLHARRLPIGHGRRHGKNAHNKVGKPRSKREEIAEADRSDFELRERIEALDLPRREKDAEIAKGLSRRLNMSTLKKLHAFVRRAFTDARAHLDGQITEMPPVFKRFREEAKTAIAKELADGQQLATRRRLRSSWTDERLQTLFTSPIYQGAKSSSRAKRGDLIIRDAIYWVPLIISTMGARPDEILHILKTEVVIRSGIPVIKIRESAGRTLKNEASERTIPISDILLKLGFFDWVNARREEKGSYLFADISDSDTKGRLSGIFGGRFTSVRKGLGILDEEEDFYALRRTFNSRLSALGVRDSDCSALLGHTQKDITNRHYTDKNLAQLKRHIDRVDYRFTIAMDSKRGHPVLADCRLDMRQRMRVSLTLLPDGNPTRVSLGLPDGVRSWDIMPLQSWSSYEDIKPDANARKIETVAQDIMTELGDRAPTFSSDEERAAWEYLSSFA